MYIGLNDKDEKRQKIATAEAVRMIAEAVGDCTLSERRGAWRGMVENTIVCEIMFTPFEDAERLKRALNQESIIIERARVHSEAV